MKKRIALILFAAMLVSMLAGCGGDSSTDSTDGSAGTTETSGADPSDSSIQGKFLYIITDNLETWGSVTTVCAACRTFAKPMAVNMTLLSWGAINPPMKMHSLMPATVVNTHTSSPVPMAACQIWCSSMVRISRD